MKEVEVIEGIINKISERFPNLLVLLSEDFSLEFGLDILENKHLGQIFYSWLFSECELSGGKKFISLCKEFLELNEDEKIILKNIEEGIKGVFEVLKIGNDSVLVRDKYFFFGGIYLLENPELVLLEIKEYFEDLTEKEYDYISFVYHQTRGFSVPPA